MFFTAISLFAPRAEAADVTATVSPTSGTYSSDFTVRVRATGTDIAGIDFTMTYNTSLVSVSSISLGSGVSTWTEISKSTSGGTIRYAIGVAAGSPVPINGSAEVAVIVFSPQSAGTLDLSFANFEATDSTPASLSVSSTDGEYSVSGSGSGSSLPDSAVVSPTLFGITLGGAITGIGSSGILYFKDRRRRKERKKNPWME